MQYPTLHQVVPTTIPSLVTISKHMHYTLCLVFKYGSATVMDPYLTTLHVQGIELFHQFLGIFNPKWLTLDHSNKIIEFYQFYRRLDMSVDKYSPRFKCWVSQLDYSSIVFPASQLFKQFINNLGEEFRTVHNTNLLLLEWSKTNIDALTTAA